MAAPYADAPDADAPVQKRETSPFARGFNLFAYWRIPRQAH